MKSDYTPYALGRRQPTPRSSDASETLAILGVGDRGPATAEFSASRQSSAASRVILHTCIPPALQACRRLLRSCPGPTPATLFGNWLLVLPRQTDPLAYDHMSPPETTVCGRATCLCSRAPRGARYVRHERHVSMRTSATSRALVSQVAIDTCLTWLTSVKPR